MEQLIIKAYSQRPPEREGCIIREWEFYNAETEKWEKKYVYVKDTED